jgi:mRNA interferase MazF
VIVQNDIGNRYSSATIVAAITTKFAGRPYPFLVTLPKDVLQRPSAVDCAQLRTVDAARISTGRLARLDPEVMREVDEALKASLGVS